MRVCNLSLQELIQFGASDGGLCLNLGSFIIRLHCKEAAFFKVFSLLYQHFLLVPSDAFADFNIELVRPANYRRWVNPQILFKADGRVLFDPFPLSHAMPLFEWGLNWCFARRSHQYLMLHSAVVEKHNKVLILPASPGSGKSTLSAALAQRGWRFLSDEFGLIRPADGHAIPIPRPTPLKNESIQVIREFSPDAVLGPLFPKTRKGTVAHLRAPRESVLQIDKTGLPAWVIFPHYKVSSTTVLTQLPEHTALLKIASHSFNYEIMGSTGFKLLRDMVNTCHCYDLTYSNLDDVIARLDEISEQ